MRAHLAAAQDVTLGDPPRIPASAPTVSVFIDGEKVRIPADWSLAFSTSKGKDTLYALEPSKVLHVLTLNRDGQLREMHGMSAALLDDIFRWRFPRVRR